MFLDALETGGYGKTKKALATGILIATVPRRLLLGPVKSLFGVLHS